MINIHRLVIIQNWYQTFVIHLGVGAKYRKSIAQGCTNPGRQLAKASKLYMVAPSICGPSVLNILPVTILTWLLDFWKMYAPPATAHIPFAR